MSPADPRAIRSRRDLTLINHLMGGERWIIQSLVSLKPKRVLEIGAGHGALTTTLSRLLPETQLEALDLIARPKGLPDKVRWTQGDLFEYEGYDSQTIVVANLFLHHFRSAQLTRFSEQVAGTRGLLLAEPYRSRRSLLMGSLLFPFINEVTRHDMMVSIRAGFRRAELKASFEDAFALQEEVTLLGGIRLKAIKP